ncbi:MAG: hypothetical protein ACRDH8_15090 [Actinomycetota bacterium]
MRRTTQALVGAMLLVAGILGLVSTATWGASASARARDYHGWMDRMMEAVHGPETVARMHRIPGAEEMMDRCGAMMAMMDGMSGGMMMGMIGGGTVGEGG